MINKACILGIILLTFFITSSARDQTYTIEQTTIPTDVQGDAGQSFTTVGGGGITDIEIYSLANTSATLKVNSGQEGGTELYSQAVNLTAGGWQKIFLTSWVAVNASTQYSFMFEGGDMPRLAYTTSNEYDGGCRWLSGTWYGSSDLAFKVYIDQSLPVELRSFTAEEGDGTIILKWVTESETDNLGYILERKTAATDWQQIASYQTHDALKGAGNTSSRTEYAFTDVNVFTGETYRYRLSDVDFMGTITIQDVLEIKLTEAPEKTELEPAFPNPFNPETKIGYKLAEDAEVTLKVVDLMGRTVTHILEGRFQKAGSYNYFWNGKDDMGRLQPSGVYVLVLNAGYVTKVQKVMLVR